MTRKLFIIGNGFDLDHDLPTKFDPDFKNIAKKNETYPDFWDIYQSETDDIWSDFENLLAKPDFDEIESIFEGYYPDYTSDRESDRDSIISVAEMSANLQTSLKEFIIYANNALNNRTSKSKYLDLFDKNDYYLTFNYTDTLRKLYSIPSEQILHIHGEKSSEELIIGFSKGDLDIGTKFVEIKRGRGYEITMTKYIEEIDDYYIHTAFDTLVSKVEKFEKEIQKEKLNNFISKLNVNEIIIIGFSFGKVDAPYFNDIIERFPKSKIFVTAHNEDDLKKKKENIRDYYAGLKHEHQIL